MRHPIRDSLKNAGYDLKERAKVYTYMTAGAVLPLIWMRYGCVPHQEASSGIESEAGKWLMAVAYSLIPSVIGAFVGTGIGISKVGHSRFKRFKRREEMGKNSLENSVQEGVK